MAKAQYLIFGPVAAALLLSACGSGGSSSTSGSAASSAVSPEEAKRNQLSQTNPELPDGMRLFTGQRNTFSDFSSQPAGTHGGKIITYVTIGMPWVIRDFYEEEGKRLGFEVIGRVTAGDFQSIDLRRPQGDTRKPHTVSVMAVHKTDYTNVTINIDITQ